MEMKKELGGELELDVKIENGKAILIVKHEGKLGSIELKGTLDAVILVDKITDAIPGEWDDTLLDPLVAKLMAKKSE